MFLDRIDQGLVAGQGAHGAGQQQALDVHRDARAGPGRVGNHLADGGFNLHRVFLGDHAPVQLEHHFARNDVGVSAPFDAAHIQIGVVDAGDLRPDGFVKHILCIQRVQNLHRALQRIDTAFGNGRVRLSAMDGDFHLQAAIVGGDHLIAEAGGNQQVGFGELVTQQPARAQLTAKLFVVGEMQLDGAVQGDAQRLQRPHCEGKTRKVRLADRRCPAVNMAVHNGATVGVLRPAVTRWNHVAMGVERNRDAGAVVAAHDQVGQ